MDLEQLKDEWQRRDLQFSRQLDHVNAQLRDALLARHAEQVVRLNDYGWIYWLAFLFTVLCLGTFIADHIDQPRFVIPAALLQIWTIAMHATHMFYRHALLRLDYNLPIVTLQRQIAHIRNRRLRQFKWGFLTGQILWWVPFCIVLAKGMLGIDLYAINDFMPGFMLANVVGGLVAIPLLLVAARAMGDRFGNTSPVRRLVDSLSGRDLQASQQFLARLAAFEDVAGC